MWTAVFKTKTRMERQNVALCFPPQLHIREKHVKKQGVGGQNDRRTVENESKVATTVNVTTKFSSDS